jgi:hypothetical protein
MLREPCIRHLHYLRLSALEPFEIPLAELAIMINDIVSFLQPIHSLLCELIEGYPDSRLSPSLEEGGSASSLLGRVFGLLTVVKLRLDKPKIFVRKRKMEQAQATFTHGGAISMTLILVSFSWIRRDCVNEWTAALVAE